MRLTAVAGDTGGTTRKPRGSVRGPYPLSLVYCDATHRSTDPAAVGSVPESTYMPNCEAHDPAVDCPAMEMYSDLAPVPGAAYANMLRVCCQPLSTPEKLDCEKVAAPVPVTPTLTKLLTAPE